MDKKTTAHDDPAGGVLFLGLEPFFTNLLKDTPTELGISEMLIPWNRHLKNPAATRKQLERLQKKEGLGHNWPIRTIVSGLDPAFLKEMNESMPNLDSAISAYYKDLSFKPDDQRWPSPCGDWFIVHMVAFHIYIPAHCEEGSPDPDNLVAREKALSMFLMKIVEVEFQLISSEKTDDKQAWMDLLFLNDRHPAPSQEDIEIDRYLFWIALMGLCRRIWLRQSSEPPTEVVHLLPKLQKGKFIYSIEVFLSKIQRDEQISSKGILAERMGITYKQFQRIRKGETTIRWQQLKNIFIAKPDYPPEADAELQSFAYILKAMTRAQKNLLEQDIPPCKIVESFTDFSHFQSRIFELFEEFQRSGKLQRP